MNPTYELLLTGFFSGVFVCILLYFTVYLTSNRIARRLLRDVFRDYGVPNGSQYYQDLARSCPSEEGRAELEAEQATFNGLRQKHEARMDEIAKKYRPSE